MSWLVSSIAVPGRQMAYILRTSASTVHKALIKKIRGNLKFLLSKRFLRLEKK